MLQPHRKSGKCSVSGRSPGKASSAQTNAASTSTAIPILKTMASQYTQPTLSKHSQATMATNPAEMPIAVVANVEAVEAAFTAADTTRPSTTPSTPSNTHSTSNNPRQHSKCKSHRASLRHGYTTAHPSRSSSNPSRRPNPAITKDSAATIDLEARMDALETLESAMCVIR